MSLINKKTGANITEAKVKLKVKAPTKKTQNKEMYWLPKMKYFGEDFDLSQTGQYQLTCQFEIQGKKRKAEFFFKIK